MTAKPIPKHWHAEAVEVTLASQGIALAPGRAERIARAQEALLGASAADPLLATLEFQADPSGFLLALKKAT